MKPTLQIKHYGDKIRTYLLNSDRFAALEQLKNQDIKFPKFGILTRYENGTVGVSIHYMGEKEKDGKRYGYWLQEDTEETSIEQWAKVHDDNPSFSSVQDMME